MKRKSFLSYLGGKSLLADKIIPMIPPHTCYCEVFAGAAWILFKKEESVVEIINDINTDLVTLYRVVKHHLEEFIRYFKWVLIARDEFERFKKERPDTLTDIQRAVRFYYLLRMGFSGQVRNHTFGVCATGKPRLNLLRIEEDLSAAHLRLSRVFIENMPYERLIERFDRPGTFFYIDPPYYGCEDDYGKGIFSREDFNRLRTLLGGLQGKFIMSINDRSEIRKLYRGFSIDEVGTTYTAGGGGTQKRVTELLIRNF